MTDRQIEQLAVGAVGIVTFAVIMHLIAWCKLCDRVTRLEALVKLLEKEIIAIHKNEEGDTDA